MKTYVITPKIKRYIEAYLETWNGTTAATIAGYRWPTKAAWRLMKIPQVQEAISNRLNEAGMPANEVVTRISQDAKVNMGDFLLFKRVIVLDENEQPIIDPLTSEPLTRLVNDGINWEMVRSHGYLIKELSYDRRGSPIIKLVDTQKAKDQLGRIHGMFRDNIELTGKDGGPLTWKEFVEKDDQPEASDL
jgi:phage terminase small subunit